MQKPQPNNNNTSIRLNKFLAERLGVSRREADELISAGKITINNKTANLGDRIELPTTTHLQKTASKTSSTPVKIDKNYKICYNDKIVPLQADFLYIAFHKPVGYVCSRHAQGKSPTLYEILPAKYKQLKTVGRLDKDSSGLILLTNDGDFAYKMTHPKFHKQKVYEVELDKPLEPLHQQMISDFGIMLDDGPSKFTVIKNELAKPLSRGIRSRYEDAATSPVKTGARSVPRKTVLQAHYIAILSEGRNRQIRRTFAALGYTVTKLHRTKFGKYELGNLSCGKFEVISV